MKYFVAVILLVFGTFCFLAGEPVSEETVLATWQGGQFTKSDLDAQLNKIPAQYQAQYKTRSGQEKILESLCLEQVFYLAGLRMHLDSDSTILKQVETNMRPALVQSYRNNEFKKNVVITPEDEQKYYQENLSKYYTDRPRTSILYIQVKDDSAATAASQMFAANADFIDVMNNYSIHKVSRNNSGKITNLRSNGSIPGLGRDAKLDSLITTAEMNRLYGPVKTSTGIHFFKVTDRQPERVMSFDECKKDIDTKLQPIKESDNYFRIASQLAEQYKVVINDSLIAKISFTRDDTPLMDSFLATGSIPDLNITVADFMQKFRSAAPQEQGAIQDKNGRKRYLQNMIEDALFYLDAQAKGYADSASVKADVAQIRRATITRAAYSELVAKQIQVSDDSIKDFYSKNEDRYTTKPYRKIQAFVMDDEKTADMVLKLARKALKKKNEDSLNVLVQKYSKLTRLYGVIDNIADNGSIPGSGPDSLFASLVWKAKVGKFSEVFQNAKGQYVFFRLLEIRPSKLKSMEDQSVKGDIKMRLQRDATKVKFDEVSAQLKQEFNLQTFSERLQVKLSAQELFDMANEAQSSKKYQTAADYYDQIIESFKNGDDDYKALFMKGFLYAEDMKDNEKAKAAFTKLIQDFPKGELHESAEYMLKSLNGEVDVMKEIEDSNPPASGKE